MGVFPKRNEINDILSPVSSCFDLYAMEIKVDVLVDASGLTCPLPLLKAKQALNKLEPGQVVHLVCTDSGSVKDFKVFCDQSGHQLLDSTNDDTTYAYWLQKA